MICGRLDLKPWANFFSKSVFTKLPVTNYFFFQVTCLHLSTLHVCLVEHKDTDAYLSLAFILFMLIWLTYPDS